MLKDQTFEINERKIYFKDRRFSTVSTFLEKLTKNNDLKKKKKKNYNNRDTVAAEIIITDLAMHTRDNTNNIFASVISSFFLSFSSSSRKIKRNKYAEETYENKSF